MNQFLPSILDWKEEGLVLEQTTNFPREQGTTLRVNSSRSAPRTIHIRTPGWTNSASEVKINGRALEANADPGSYLALRRIWKDGDTIIVSLPMELRQELLSGDDSVAAALYGPLVLAADLGRAPADESSRVLQGGDPVPKKLPAADPLLKAAAGPDAKTGQWVQVDSKDDRRFTAAGENGKHSLMPMFQISDQRYGVYWQMQRSAKLG